MTQKQQWIEIAIELKQHLQDPVANFLIELGAEGVITDEDIINPLTGKIKPDKKHYKLLRAYLKKNNRSQKKIESLNHYIKSLVEIHSLSYSPELRLTVTNEEDWNKKWQKFFSTTRIGNHIIIKPSWELFLPEEGDQAMYGNLRIVVMEVKQNRIARVMVTKEEEELEEVIDDESFWPEDV